MKSTTRKSVLTLGFVFMVALGMNSCTKSDMDSSPSSNTEQVIIKSAQMNSSTPAQPNFNLEVILHGENNGFGLVKFRQDVEATKIVTLDTWVRDLEPNHEYLLQRAVDTNIDGNCTGTNWLTLGNGLSPESILTNDKGTGNAALWRDISSIPTGATFDIHFQVKDKVSGAVVLTSDCYTYTVR